MMTLRIAFYAFFMLAAAVTDGQIAQTETYLNSISPRNGNIIVYWKFNDTHITFEVHAETTSWVGIGFSPNGAMTGADIFIGWVKDGEVKVTDRHGVGNIFPPLDPQQDIDVLTGTECDGWTMFKFSRQLAACENEYDREITASTQRLIWAWGNSDPDGSDVEPKNYHGTIQRGVQSIHLLGKSNAISNNDFVGPEFQRFDITVDNFEIPAADTHYNCRVFELPALNKKHHIVKFEQVVSKENERLVHHMILMSCGRHVQGDWEVGANRACSSPDPTIFCTSMISAFAVGATSFALPDVAGFSIGTEEDPLYVMLQTHYDNPGKISGITDSSGIRITYTSQIRRFDSGVLAVNEGVSGTRHYIPPGAASFLTVVQCTPVCLQQKMVEAGVQNITIFQANLHSHLAGRAMRVRHIRNEIELPYIVSDMTYDFNYQDYVAVDPRVTVLPGDTIQAECIYSTVDRDFVTQGGESTSDEMCFAILGYYPKIDLGYCTSFVSADISWKYFGIEDNERTGNPVRLNGYNITAPARLAGKTPLEVISEYPWTKEKIEDFNSFVNGLEHRQICRGKERTDVLMRQFNLSDIETTYVTPQRNCSEPSSPLKQTIRSGECSSVVTKYLAGSIRAFAMTLFGSYLMRAY